MRQITFDQRRPEPIAVRHFRRHMATTNHPRSETRDREVKRKLYSRRGVSEYWVISCQKRQLEVYRRTPDQPSLELETTLYESDTLKSPLLPGFTVVVADLFAGH